MTHEDIREQVLEQVLPEDAEREQNQKMFGRIQGFIADEFELDAALMGSTAKETFISGDKDLDVFVFFPTDVSEDELEEQGLSIGEAVFEEFGGAYNVEYADHPYTKGRIDGYEVEIVPAYDVESGEDIRSAVDRTPFHTEWVNEHLSEAQKEDVVLLKTFLRGQDLYGSTLKIEGFSGYLCELLIAQYGSFEELLQAAVDWQEDQVIDPADHHESLPNFLKQKFSEEALVVIDPVDPERNVASVLNTEHYAEFVYAAWKYLEDPEETFFFQEEDGPQEVDVERALVDRGDFVLVQFPTPDMIDDILYPQLRRLLRRLEQVLEDNEFRLFESGFHVGAEYTRVLFELYSDNLPDTRKQIGPKVFHNTEHVANFTDKYEKVWVEDTRLVTIVPREYTDAETLLREFLRGDLQEKGVPDNLVPHVEQREFVGLDVDGADWRRFLRDTFKLGG